jgi:hypothetical protein
MGTLEKCVISKAIQLARSSANESQPPAGQKAEDYANRKIKMGVWQHFLANGRR